MNAHDLATYQAIALAIGTWIAMLAWGYFLILVLSENE